MPTRRHPQVINLAELEPEARLTGTRFGGAMKGLGRATGARGIGCTWFEVPPGRSAFPKHYHCANEESLFVLEGEGTLHLGDEDVKVGAGDYVTFLTGPDHAHRLENTGAGPLRYLCFSTMQPVEVVGYPDSGKIGAMARSGSGAPAPWVRGIFRGDAQVGYFEGEDIG